jgi:hypothetical protein
MGLLRWFRKSPDAGSATSLVPPGADLDTAIAAVAAVRGEAARREASRQVPRLFDPEAIPELACRLDRLAEPPPAFSAREPSACAWIACWHASIFDILACYGEQSVPTLQEMARAGHFSAVVTLCRIAAHGCDRDRVVAGIRALIQELPASMLGDAAGQLVALSREEPGLAAVVEDLRQVTAFEEALVEARRFADD